MTFKEEIEKGLEGLSVEQKRTFAWRCAVRSMPILGSTGSFSFWSKEIRPKHLWSVFYALDISYAAANATLAAFATFFASASAVDADEAFVDAVDAASNATIAAKRFKVYLNSIIRQDLINIKTNKKPQISITK